MLSVRHGLSTVDLQQSSSGHSVLGAPADSHAEKLMQSPSYQSAHSTASAVSVFMGARHHIKKGHFVHM